jgi:signal peptidase II
LAEHHGGAALDAIDTHPEPGPEPLPVRDPAAGRRPATVALFAVLAIAIVIADQLLKNWVVSSYEFDRPSEVVGDWLRIDLIHNAGGLFGMLQGSAPALGLVSAFVLVVLVAVELRMGWRSWILTLTLGLLLGGAIGNFVDRFRYQYVVDFVDIGIGAWRFYIFNLADSAITCSLGLILGLAILGPWLEEHSALFRRLDGKPEPAAPVPGATGPEAPGR